MSIFHPEEKELEIAQVIEMGKEARRRLEGPLAKEVRAEVERRMLEQWVATEPDAVAIREKVHSSFVALQFVDEVLRGIINDGEHAEDLLQKREAELESE